MSLWDDSWGYVSPGQTADRDRMGTQKRSDPSAVNTGPLLTTTRYTEEVA